MKFSGWAPGLKLYQSAPGLVGGLTIAISVVKARALGMAVVDLGGLSRRLRSVALGLALRRSYEPQRFRAPTP